MTKHEFLTRLEALLRKNGVADVQDILEEYEQHFAFKMTDGYSEEEIAAKLGNPAQIAAQYEAADNGDDHRRSPVLTRIGLGFVDVFAGFFFILVCASGVVFSVTSIAFAALGISLIAGVNPFGLIPSIPYWCGAILGFAMVALGILSAVGCVYYWSLIRQMIRSFARFQYNTMASAVGKPVLPSLPVRAKLTPKTKRFLRNVMLISLMTFAVCFVLGFIASAISAGSVEFWHVWGWFGGAA